MMDSLAEQVPGPVMMYTLLRFSVGSALARGPAPANPCVVEWNGVGVEGFAGHRIAARILVVEDDLLERAAAGQRGVADHVGELAGDVEIAAAVVAQVEDQIGDVGVVEQR